jgi:hypothetical protein
LPQERGEPVAEHRMIVDDQQLHARNYQSSPVVRASE